MHFKFNNYLKRVVEEIKPLIVMKELNYLNINKNIYYLTFLCLLWGNLARVKLNWFMICWQIKIYTIRNLIMYILWVLHKGNLQFKYPRIIKQHPSISNGLVRRLEKLIRSNLRRLTSMCRAASPLMKFSNRFQIVCKRAVPTRILKIRIMGGRGYESPSRRVGSSTRM